MLTVPGPSCHWARSAPGPFPCSANPSSAPPGARAGACKTLPCLGQDGKPHSPTATLGQVGAETSFSAPAHVLPTRGLSSPSARGWEGGASSGMLSTLMVPALLSFASTLLTPFLRQGLSFPALGSSSSRFSTPPPTLPPGGGSINYSLFPALKMKNAKDHYHSINGAITT